MEVSYLLMVILTSLQLTNAWSSNVSNNRNRRAVKIIGTRTASWIEMFNNSEVLEYLYNPMASTMRTVGLFLAAHKYFEIDRRYSFTKTRHDISEFFKHFPKPRLKNRHPAVVTACNKGLTACVNEIFATANKSGSLAKIHKRTGKPAHYPFKDSLELFRYRTTASYYMCWYTDRREALLARFDDYPCFKDLELTAEANGKRIFDFRTHYPNGRTSLFTCAYLLFCPDSCYGKSTGGNVINLKQAVADKLNPCKVLNDKTCFWNVGENSNIEDLARNKLNYTCNCEQQFKGFKWDPQYSMCVDRDECYEGKYKCPHDQICRNTVGAYKCTCRRGYYLNKHNRKCVRYNLLSAAGAKALDKKKKGKQALKEKQKGGLFYVLELLVEIVRAHGIIPSWSKTLYTICLLYTFILKTL